MQAGLVQILEGALLAAGEPLSVQRMSLLFEENERPSKEDIRAAIKLVEERCEDRGYELVQVASGYRFQVRQDLATWVGRLWQERPARYSRALMETLSLIAYRQPITRGEIEEIRGISLSKGTMDILLELAWIKPRGRRRTPGRPLTWGTSPGFLDHFGLGDITDLPGVEDLKAAGLLRKGQILGALMDHNAGDDKSDEFDSDDADGLEGGVLEDALLDIGYDGGADA